MREKLDYESQIGAVESFCAEVESKYQLQSADLNRSFEVEKRKLVIRCESAEEKAFKEIEKVKLKEIEVDELLMKNGALIAESEIKSQRWNNEKRELELKLEMEKGQVMKLQSHVDKVFM
jgi:hypothetical protein